MRIPAHFARTAVATTVALAGMTAAAQALTIQVTSGFETTRSINSGANENRFVDSLSDTDGQSLSQFDSSLGTLNSVTVSVSGSVTRSAGARFRDDTIFSTTDGEQIMSGIRLSLTLPGFFDQVFVANSSDSCQSGTGGLSGSSCTTSFGTTVGLGAFLGGTLTGGDLAAYIGPGSIGALFQQTGSLETDETQPTQTDNGYVDSREGTLAFRGSIRLVYDYTEPPPPPTGVAEPAALGLLGLGLVGIGVARRQRRRS